MNETSQQCSLLLSPYASYCDYPHQYDCSLSLLQSLLSLLCTYSIQCQIHRTLARYTKFYDITCLVLSPVIYLLNIRPNVKLTTELDWKCIYAYYLQRLPWRWLDQLLISQLLGLNIPIRLITLSITTDNQFTRQVHPHKSKAISSTNHHLYKVYSASE